MIPEAVNNSSAAVLISECGQRRVFSLPHLYILHHCSIYSTNSTTTPKQQDNSPNLAPRWSESTPTTFPQRPSSQILLILSCTTPASSPPAPTIPHPPQANHTNPPRTRYIRLQSTTSSTKTPGKPNGFSATAAPNAPTTIPASMNAWLSCLGTQLSDSV
jgi:hypothetical protein